jgi:hypothetical protein
MCRRFRASFSLRNAHHDRKIAISFRWNEVDFGIMCGVCDLSLFPGVYMIIIKRAGKQGRSTNKHRFRSLQVEVQGDHSRPVQRLKQN